MGVDVLRTLTGVLSMKRLTYLLGPALVFLLCAAPADAGKKKNKKKADGVNGDFAGTVVSIAKGEGESPAILTSKTEGAKKKAAGIDRRFELPRGPRLESVTVAKKAFGIKPATVEDI